MRHTYAILTLSEGTLAHAVGQILGNSETSIAQDIFAHDVPIDQAQTMATMTGLFVSE